MVQVDSDHGRPCFDSNFRLRLAILERRLVGAARSPGTELDLATNVPGLRGAPRGWGAVDVASMSLSRNKLRPTRSSDGRFGVGLVVSRVAIDQHCGFDPKDEVREWQYSFWNSVSLSSR
jgi:hypothetical protein